MKKKTPKQKRLTTIKITIHSHNQLSSILCFFSLAFITSMLFFPSSLYHTSMPDSSPSSSSSNSLFVFPRVDHRGQLGLFEDNEVNKVGLGRSHLVGEEIYELVKELGAAHKVFRHICVCIVKK